MNMVKRFSILVLIGMMLAVMNQPVWAGQEKININTATKKELVELKHVGDKIADRIIEYRKAQPFEMVEDIMKVKGIGPKVYEANKDRMTVKD